MEMLAYQRMEEFLMNRIRQLSNQMNRMNALVVESLNMSQETPLQIPDCLYHRLTRAEVVEMKQEIPIVNMWYLREVIVKFISFPRGSSERTFLFPVMKSLLSLGEREMRVGEGETNDQ